MGTNFSKWEIKCFFNRRQKIFQKLKVMSVKLRASTTKSHTYAGVCVNFLQPPFLSEVFKPQEVEEETVPASTSQAKILKSESQGVNNHKSERLVLIRYIWTQNGWDKAKQSEQIVPNAGTSIYEKRAKGMPGNIAPRL